MKILLGLFLCSLSALFTVSDTKKGAEERASHQFVPSPCLEEISRTTPAQSVMAIPPVGCAIPVAHLEKFIHAQ
ncbi:MAG: hypothetical protein R2822_04950 [Spirosomataceae bacterium]